MLHVGRFFACSTHTLALRIHSKKKAADDSMMYLTGDGLFGSFGYLNYIPTAKFKPLLLEVIFLRPITIIVAPCSIKIMHYQVAQCHVVKQFLL